MKNIDFGKMAERYRSELYDSVLPFWLNKSQDEVYGGYFTFSGNLDNIVYICVQILTEVSRNSCSRESKLSVGIEDIALLYLRYFAYY